MEQDPSQGQVIELSQVRSQVRKPGQTQAPSPSQTPSQGQVSQPQPGPGTKPGPVVARLTDPDVHAGDQGVLFLPESHRLNGYLMAPELAERIGTGLIRAAAAVEFGRLHGLETRDLTEEELSESAPEVALAGARAENAAVEQMYDLLMQVTLTPEQALDLIAMVNAATELRLENDDG